MPDQTTQDARQILDAAPYDAGDAPTATARPLPVHDDLQRLTAELTHTAATLTREELAHAQTTADRDQLASMLAQIGDAISPTGERPEEALGTLVADVEALVEQRDQAVADLVDTRERLQAATTAIRRIRAGLEMVDRALAAYDDTDPDEG